ncbi:MAG TPA: type I-MYXAN CRISPR-associated protein Cas6/Cmx6 [Burkholderiaceae bacterium]|nr:type I-MYXAN CRISPR-associated protein Cas6/Cmx6 [Burkholderiaceae bacterium]
MASDGAVAASVDVAFPLRGASLPREHRCALAESLRGLLPWLDEARPRAALHRLNVTGGDATRVLLSQRTRLVLRVPRARADDAAAALAGQRLDVAGHPLVLGAAQVRELLPWGTLYAHLVVTGDADELAFQRALEVELEALGVRCRIICGRLQPGHGGGPAGYSVMLDGLSAADALRVQEAGLGRHREWGCGVFVPHKSAAAVGTPE